MPGDVAGPHCGLHPIVQRVTPRRFAMRAMATLAKCVWGGNRSRQNTTAAASLRQSIVLWIQSFRYAHRSPSRVAQQDSIDAG